MRRAVETSVTAVFLDLDRGAGFAQVQKKAGIRGRFTPARVPKCA